MSQPCSSHACAWPRSPLTRTPDPDPWWFYRPGNSSLWTCPSTWTTSDFIFARPALLFENCGTAPRCGGHGPAGHPPPQPLPLRSSPRCPWLKVSQTICAFWQSQKENRLLFPVHPVLFTKLLFLSVYTFWLLLPLFQDQTLSRWKEKSGKGRGTH